MLSATCKHHRVKFRLQLCRCNVRCRVASYAYAQVFVAHHNGRFKGDALGFHLRNTAINVRLFHFEVGNAVAKQAADPIRFFKYRHGVPRSR